MKRPAMRKRPKRKPEPGVTLRDTPTALATIRHDVATGNLDHARMVMKRISDWQDGDVMQASPAHILAACDVIERAMAEMTGQESTN